MTYDTSPVATKPWGLKWRSNTTFILATVGIGLFTDLFLYGIVVPILPFILTDRLNIPHSEVQTWTSALLASYAGASVVFSIPAGIIADKLPARQVPFLAGLVALLASTLLFSLGETIWVLILARIFQGLSAAVVWTVGLAMVLDTVGSDKLGVVIGSIFSFISIGELMAPVLGGIVYQKSGNGAVFGMGFGLLAIDFVMRFLLIEKKIARQYGETDEDDEVAAIDAADEEANEDTALLGERRKEEEQWKIPENQNKAVQSFPMLYCLGNARLLVAELIAFTQATLLATLDSTIPTEAQELFGVDSLSAGLLFVPSIIPYLCLGSLAGTGVDRYGPKYFAAFGLAYLVLPLVLLRIPQAGGTAEVVKFCVFQAMLGFGLAAISSPSVVEASYVVEKYYKHNKEFFGEQGPYAQLYAINSMVFSAGLTLGPLVAGTLRDQIGYGNMNACVAGLCAVVGVLSYVYIGGKPKTLKR